MLDMAQHYEEGPIQLGTIAKRQDIPVKYLEQIIIPLKKANYVKSSRGYKGGHMLAKPPGEITVGEIVVLMEGGLKLTVCTEDPASCGRSGTCLTRLLWKEATEAMYEKLKSITLSDLLKMGQKLPPNQELQGMGCDHNGRSGDEDCFHCDQQE
jgi:Rrf2 family protein